MKTFMVRGALSALALIACGIIEPASAQTAPSYRSALGNGTLDGIVVRFSEGGYTLGLREDGGYYDNVQLHDGTIIFPIGLSLRPGMRVRIVGFTQGSAFTANEIDGPRREPVPALREPRWYSQWEAGAGYRNPPAAAYVNPPAAP